MLYPYPVNLPKYDLGIYARPVCLLTQLLL